ncbi:electron transport complex subunit RsxD [Aliiglaciecola sp. LCG003]|uniref:electron transport complex subunit RsxD n=1 Tax=Aliiglaciecola sp. LCG003 TaxID=3053655 RepID=UPI002572B4A5|nr:electron transport complex subunit RsxD [Aliiglaciecola sp. LCG003]WJG08277.1 electron transport complex subunit RsxD [Aliiglaciecola sp. LCG003]
MGFKIASSPHQRVKRTTGQVMRLVIYAGLPAIALQTWFFGWGAIIHFAIAAITVVVTEATLLEMRKKNFEVAIKDCSALLTAFLIAVSIPPLAPWWITVIGSFFAIAIVKQLYGGLGFNLFNPAMAAYVMLLVSFPVEMSTWAIPQSLSQFPQSFMDSVSIVFTGFSADGYSIEQLRTHIDGYTMATPLDAVKTAVSQGMTVQESGQLAMFESGLGVGWFEINIAYLLGGLYLLKTKVINWHIPAGVIAGMVCLSLVMYMVDNGVYSDPIFHLFSGGFMLGAFFIATDPVSASTTNRGRIIFGFGIGAWIYIIRTWGGYPDAIAFAVLIMNMAVPLIDYYTRPRTYGHHSDHKKNIVVKSAESKSSQRKD